MATRKIADLPKEETCRDQQHNLPTHMVYPKGVYEHICPSCGKKQCFTIRKPRWEGVT
jgi:hypothetical protein